jgi:HlyD family secretion protein
MVEQAEQQVAVGEARVAAARAALDLAVAGATDETVQAARGQVKQAEGAVAAARARVEDTVVRAPADGTISEVILRQGEAATPGSVVVRMLDLQHLWVRVYLPVPQFGRVKRGQPAEVTADAYPAKRYTGQVLTVSDQAEFTPKNTQTVEERVKEVFWVKVGVGNGLGELKAGMPVDVALRVGAQG